MEANQTRPGESSLDTITEQIQEGIENGKYTWREIQQAVVTKTREVAESTDEYVKENPWKVIGVAAALGVVFGLLLAPKSDD